MLSLNPRRPPERVRDSQAPTGMSDAVFDAQVQANRFFCISCDRDEVEVQDWLRDNPGQGDPDGDCCIAALTGEPLRFTNKQVTAMWDLSSGPGNRPERGGSYFIFTVTLRPTQMCCSLAHS